jgi:acyl carrier protein
MKQSREAVLSDVLMLLQRVAADWDFSGEITEHTYLSADLGFQSLDVVVLGTAVQEHYGRLLPFSELFAAIGQQEVKDISVGEWVDFVYTHLDAVPAPDVEAVAGS